MHRALSRFLPLASLSGSMLLMASPAIAGSADDSIATVPAAGENGATIAVANCNDSGPGSLRAAVAGAASGDTIDMAALSCRRINLTSGAIAIPQDDLGLVGGGRITVDANGTSSVFRHLGTGRLRIRGMTIARGFLRSDTEALGGCIYSAGSIELNHALVHWCNARATGNGIANGGGVYAAGTATLANSQVVGNTAGHADPLMSYHSAGGGIYVRGHLAVMYSRVCGNHAHDGSGALSNAGGLEAVHATFSGNTGGQALLVKDGDATIMSSEISGNSSPMNVVSITRSWQAPGWNVVIADSTISGNMSTYGSVLAISAETKSIVNSTIAFNRQSTYCDYGGGTLVLSGTPPHIESTIIANSTCGGQPFTDLAIHDTQVEGANNLIMSSNAPLPPDTISVDPGLAPLADNGGDTRTHALPSDSPAVDMGNNAAGLAYDQRGAGFARVKGLRADIGSYER